MMPKNITYSRESAQKCLLMLMLFLSICPFAGLARSTASGLPKTYTIELADSKKTTSTKRFVHYCFFVQSQTTLAKSSNHQQAILTYARLIKLKFEVMLKNMANRQPEHYLLHQKTTPQSFKESLIFTV